MPVEAKKALEKMAEIEDMPSVSALVRQLLSNYCQQNGLAVDFSVGRWGGGRECPNGLKELKSQQIGDGDLPVEARVEDGKVVVRLADGRIIATPVTWYPWLASAAPEQQANFQLGPLAIYWPDLQEGLSIEGMLKGQMRKTASPSPA